MNYLQTKQNSCNIFTNRHMLCQIILCNSSNILMCVLKSNLIQYNQWKGKLIWEDIRNKHIPLQRKTQAMERRVSSVPEDNTKQTQKSFSNVTLQTSERQMTKDHTMDHQADHTTRVHREENNQATDQTRQGETETTPWKDQPRRHRSKISAQDQ